MAKNTPEFIVIPINEIELLNDNPREINEKEFKELCKDVKKDPNFLMQRPPLINLFKGRNICYAGNQRVKAARELGFTELHVWREKNVSKQLQDERMLKDNLHRGEWSMDMLKNFDTTFLMDVGFKPDQLNGMFNDILSLSEDEFDVEKALAEIKEPTTKPGDLYILGNHKLLCGDSTLSESTQRLFGDEKAQIVYCDPPYGVSYVEGKKDFMKAINQETTNLDQFEEIANDGTIQDYYAFSMKWLSAIKPFMQAKNAVYFFNGDTKMREFLNALHDAGYYFSQLLIWNKGSAVMGRKDYQPMHELIFYGWYGTHKYFGTKDKSILQCPKPMANKLHPTMKPPMLLRKLIYHSSEPGSIVYEPFAGSGSTMVACEQLGRICYMIEMDVKYCEVIIKRYIQLCKEMGKEAIVTINGKPYKH